jgi:hypothetical protein
MSMPDVRSVPLSILILLFASCMDEPNVAPQNERHLDVQEEIQGIALIGRATFHQNGPLYQAILAREDTLFGNILPAGTFVTFRQDSTLDWCFLTESTSLEGLRCRGEGDSYMTCFHPNGRLRLAWLDGDQIVQGVPCMGATFWRDAFGGGVGTYFATNGRLVRAKLAEDDGIQGTSFSKGDRVVFDSLGVLLDTQRK